MELEKNLKQAPIQESIFAVSFYLGPQQSQYMSLETDSSVRLARSTAPSPPLLHLSMPVAGEEDLSVARENGAMPRLACW